ncbi:MAG: nucleotidyltransferase domain-containing protein [Lachnospiraceae bacterium]|nr:nucleotidyltransferase domain-containing protein [Candidatus Minthocola equi]
MEELKTIIQPIVKKYDAKSAMLFGSYARGEATAHSDIDLYVIGGRKFDKTDIFSIADDLYSATGKNVDVYESKEIDKKSALYSSIVKEGIKLV